MKLVVTGATGFTGSYVVPLLLKAGYQVRCFARESSNRAIISGDVEWALGSLDEPNSLGRALQGADGLINIASLGFGHGPGIVRATNDAGVQRAVFISTTGVFTSLNAPSKATRLAAEEAIFKSGLAFTILRPTMIYGSSRDRNMCRLIRYLMRWPLIPVFGDGTRLQQPVFVEDLARAIMLAFEARTSVGNAYSISGREPLTFNQVIDTVANFLGRRIRKLHLPANTIIKTLQLAERLKIPVPVKSEQVQRLNENKAFSFQSAADDFGYSPRSFREGIEREVAEIRASER